MEDTAWFNINWKSCSRPYATFYRVYKKTSIGYLVYDKYLNGQIQMVAEASAVRPDMVSNGACSYYGEDGMLSQRGNFSNGRKTGRWVTYINKGKDSTVTNYNPDGTREKTSAASSEEVYTIVEEQAQFPGGVNAMIKYMQDNINYPKKAIKQSLGGKAFLKFIVFENGQIMNVEVLKGTGYAEMDEEAVRVIKSMPKWIPAKMTGKPVKCYFNLPINFSLNEPFYTYNSGSSNEQYQTLARMIFEGRADEAYATLGRYDSQGDVDLLYNKAVLLYYFDNKAKACAAFKNVMQLADVKSSVYNNSKKFHTKYCHYE